MNNEIKIDYDSVEKIKGDTSALTNLTILIENDIRIGNRYGNDCYINLNNFSSLMIALIDSINVFYNDVFSADREIISSLEEVEEISSDDRTLSFGNEELNEDNSQKNEPDENMEMGILDDSSNLSYQEMYSLKLTKRTTSVSLIGNTKCLVSTPTFKDYNGEEIDLVVYAPGATESYAEKLTTSKYMGGLFSNNTLTSELGAVIVVPLAFNVNASGHGGILFETNGDNLSDEAFEYYAEFIKNATFSTYTNQEGQIISVNKNNVTLAGFSNGSKKQCELINRLLTKNGEYNNIQESLKDVHFDTVILASSGKYGIESLYQNIKSGNVDQTRLAEFKDSFVYVIAEQDEFDLSVNNQRGALYTKYNKMLSDCNLIDYQLSEDYLKSLNIDEQSRSKLSAYEGRTTLIAKKDNYTGHETSREAIVDILEVRQRENNNSLLAQNNNISR